MYDDIIWIYSFSGTYLLPINNNPIISVKLHYLIPSNRGSYTDTIVTILVVVIIFGIS